MGSFMLFPFLVAAWLGVEYVSAVMLKDDRVLPRPSCDPVSGLICLPDACGNNTCLVMPTAVCIPDRCGCEAKFFAMEKLPLTDTNLKEVRDVTPVCRSFNKVAKILKFHQPQADEAQDDPVDQSVPGTPLHLSLNRGLYEILGELIRSMDQHENMSTSDKMYIIRQATRARHALKKAFKILRRVNSLIGILRDEDPSFDVNVTVITSNSKPEQENVTLNRATRQAGFWGPFRTGQSSGTAISTGSATLGNTLTNSGTNTNPFGGSNSFATGFTSGINPTSTSIANSNSLGSMGFSGFPRFRRQQFQDFSDFSGFPVFHGIGTGTAIGTSSALSGNTGSDGRTFTDPTGLTGTVSRGSAFGSMPQATSASSSNSGTGSSFSPFVLHDGRRKRQLPEYGDDLDLPMLADFDVEMDDSRVSENADEQMDSVVDAVGRFPAIKRTKAAQLVKTLAESADLIRKSYELNLQVIREILRNDGVFHDTMEQSDMMAPSGSGKLMDILSKVSSVFDSRKKSTTTTTTPIPDSTTIQASSTLTPKPTST